MNIVYQSVERYRINPEMHDAYDLLLLSCPCSTDPKAWVPCSSWVLSEGFSSFPQRGSLGRCERLHSPLPSLQPFVSSW